eukprot:3846474-Prorocentrum_lima.AAC.1
MKSVRWQGKGLGRSAEDLTGRAFVRNEDVSRAACIPWDGLENLPDMPAMGNDPIFLLSAG